MVALFYTNSRYRIPVVPVVLAFAAVGIAALVNDAVDRKVRPLAAAAVFLALCYPLVHLNLGRTNFSGSHFNIAVNHVERAIQHRDRADAYASRAEAVRAREERRRADELFALARDQFRLGLEANPMRSDLREQFRAFLAMRADDHLRSGRRDAALDALQEFTERYPRDSDGHVRIGTLYLEMNRVADARRALRTALALDPEHLDAKSALDALLSEEQLRP
jgi:tetratricopeptide (TPR) repeat protein